MASCHSEQVGRIFIEAGVPLVICINQNQTVLDKAAIEFSKHFYDEVFDTYQSISEAYQTAKDKVEKEFGKFQADKIMLLKNEEALEMTTPLQNDRRMKKVDTYEEGRMCQVNLETEIINLPMKVSPFVSRN